MFQSGESAAGSNRAASNPTGLNNGGAGAAAADHLGSAGKFRLPADSVIDAASLTAMAKTLAALGGQPLPDAEAIDCIRALEELKCAAAAAQARVAAIFDASQRREQAAAGATADEQGKGIGVQIAPARRESPARGSRQLGFAKALVFEMPRTLNALTDGRLSEWRATLLVRETACLSVEDRAAVDSEVAGDPQALERLSDRALISAARKAAYRLDPQSVVRRAAKAHGERNVTCRPAPGHHGLFDGAVACRSGRRGSRGADAGRGRGARRRRCPRAGTDHGRHSRRAGHGRRPCR